MYVVCIHLKAFALELQGLAQYSRRVSLSVPLTLFSEDAANLGSLLAALAEGFFTLGIGMAARILRACIPEIFSRCRVLHKSSPRLV